VAMRFITKNEIVALLMSCFCVDTVAAFKKDEKHFFVAKLQEELDFDGTKIQWLRVRRLRVRRLHLQQILSTRTRLYL
jgi:hypothetical protein